jgi:hypothetical protein
VLGKIGLTIKEDSDEEGNFDMVSCLNKKQVLQDRLERRLKCVKDGKKDDDYPAETPHSLAELI